MIYVDTSAMVKALRSDEALADEVRTFIAGAGSLVSSRLLAVELHLVAQRFDIDEHIIQRVLDRVDQVAIDDGVIQSAIGLRAGLRSLDAIHLGTAAYLGAQISGLLTFNRRMLEAANQLGMKLVPLS